ncbi:MFS transporter [bacterium]|nr:MFS transporter [bacterium]
MRGLTRNYLAFQVFFALLFWLPVFYQVQHLLGLSESEIFGIQSFYYLLFCLLELPTGWLADRYGLVRSLRWGAVSLVFAHLVVVSGAFGLSLPAALSFLIHFSLIALARSLISGASNAYLYEAYSSAGRQSEYVHVEGKARAYGLIVKIVCWSGVGFLTERYVLASYWLSLGSAFVSVYFAYRLREIRWKRRQTQTGSTSALFTALRLLLNHKRLLSLMIQGMGVFVLARIIQVNLFQPLLLQGGFGVSSLGWVMALMTAGEAWASLRLKVILQRMNPVVSVSVLTAALAIVVGLFAVLKGSGTLVALVVFSVLVGFIGPIQRQVINSAIEDSSHRAMLLSLESLMDRAAASGVAFVLGIFMAQDRMGLFLVLVSSVFASIALVQARSGLSAAR